LEKEVALDQHTSLWIQKIDKGSNAYGVNDLHSNLAKIVLIPPRIGNEIQSKFQLKKYLQKYIEDGIKNGKHAQTIDKWKYTIQALFRFISPSTDIMDITELDAKNLYDSISNYEFKPNKKYSVCTLGKYVKVIRQFFEEFKDMEIISRNPFRKIRSAGNSDPSRKVYVAKEVA